MKYSRPALVALLASTVLAAGGAAAAADRGHHHDGKSKERLFTLQPDPAGNPEGITFDTRSRAFYVSSTGDGAIYRGTLGSRVVSPFIPGSAGRAAVGIHTRRGLLYVAGGGTGTITVYDLRTKRTVAEFDTGSGGFLNDLVITEHGDVFVTDSTRPVLWHVTAGQVRAGGGTPQALDVSSGIPFTAGEFNLNGIVARGSHTLIVVQSNTGRLFRIELDGRGAATSIEDIDAIAGVSVPGGDGLLLDEGRLVVVQGGPPAQLSVVKLRHGARRGEIRDTITSDLLRGSSTVDRAKDRYLVVNADFATSTRPFTVAGLPRSHRHGDDHHGDDDHGRH